MRGAWGGWVVGLAFRRLHGDPLRTGALLVLTLASTPAWAAPPTLSIGGACPGVVTLSVTGGTPNERLAWVSSSGPGSVAIPSGVCAGTPLGLDGAGLQLHALRRNDAAGEQTITPSLTAAVCDEWVQVVDLASCTVSPVRLITPPTASGWDTWLPLLVDSDYSVAGIDELSNGDLVVAGGSSPPFVVRMTPAGTVVDVTQLPTVGRVTAVDATTSGGFVVAGQRDDAADGDPTLLRFDASGGLTTGIHFDHGLYDQGFWGVQARDDGGVFIGGIFTQSVSAADAPEWNRLQIGGGGALIGMDSPDDNTLFVGGIGSYGSPAADFNHVVAKVDGAGNIVWNTAFGDAGYNWTSDVVATADGGAVGSGWTDASGLRTCNLSKLSGAGALVWSSAYTVPGVGSACHGVTASADGGYVATGNIGSNILLLKVDSTGAVEWSTNLGLGQGWDVASLSTGGYAVAAADEFNQLHVIRVDDDGQTGCDAPAGVVGTSVVYAEGANTANGLQSPVSFPAAITPTAAAIVGVAECL
jgi:hypothetical protein